MILLHLAVRTVLVANSPGHVLFFCIFCVLFCGLVSNRASNRAQPH